MSNDIFLARQPILDEDRKTFGYELLYRSNSGDSASFVDADQATRSVVEHTLLDWGIDRLVGQRFGFINSGPEIFSSGLYQALPPEGIVIEVRATAPVDEDMYDAILQARRNGYHIALDFVTSLAIAKASPVINCASMLKVDISTTAPDEVGQILDYALDINPNMKFIAEKVESHAEFEDSRAAGFHLFQGYFFAKPQVLTRQARPANAATAMALLAEVQKSDINIAEIEQLVGSDPTLAFRLLAVVNACAFGLRRRVNSLRQAIVLLGIKQVRNLAMLLTMSATENASGELITLGASRARLARSLTAADDMRDAAFTVGLLSVTDTLYGTPMDELMQELPVEPEIADALLDGSGPLGRTLNIVLACERGDLAHLTELVGDHIGDLLGLHAEAIEWADTLRGELGEPKSKVYVDGLKPLPKPDNDAERWELPAPSVA